MTLALFADIAPEDLGAYDAMSTVVTAMVPVTASDTVPIMPPGR